jgi:hypothetical protein
MYLFVLQIMNAFRRIHKTVYDKAECTTEYLAHCLVQNMCEACRFLIRIILEGILDLQ